MRILCLHGHGTSGEIFKSQTIPFRQKLPSSYTFDFPCAPLPSPPTPGIDLFYDGPFHTYWGSTTTPATILSAHTWLQNYISTHGPYDGAIGFSQGVAVLASFLLYAQKEGGGGGQQSPPFKFAVFICGGLPLVVAEEMGMRVSDAAREAHQDAGAAYSRKTHELASLDLEALEPSYSLWDEAHLPGDASKTDDTDVLGLDFSTLPPERQIQIPTLHIYGKKDPLWGVALQLLRFCDEGKRDLYDHGSGHEVPRAPAVGVEIARRIRKCAEGVE